MADNKVLREREREIKNEVEHSQVQCVSHGSECTAVRSLIRVLMWDSCLCLCQVELMQLRASNQKMKAELGKVIQESGTCFFHAGSTPSSTMSLQTISMVPYHIHSAIATQM